MTTTPDLVPILSTGAHPDPSEGACWAELASFLAGEDWSDHPACIHPVVAAMGRAVNDGLSDERRGELLALLPAAMRTGAGVDDRRLSVGLAVWCAEQVAHLAGGAEPAAREAIRVTRAWLAGEATAQECRAAARSAAGAEATWAANAAARSANAARSAAGAAARSAAGAAARAAGAAARAAGEDPVALLTGLITEYQRLTGQAIEALPLSDTDLTRATALTT